MGVVSYIADRLANVMSGRGTSVDRRTSNIWTYLPLDPAQAEAAHRNNWLARKVVEIPAKDMTREWRQWQAKGTSIEDIEAEEKRLGLQLKVMRALLLARLYGGGALYLSTGEIDPSQPLDIDRIGKGGLRFVQVLSRWELNIGEKDTDPESEWYGRPKWFQVNTANNGRSPQIHPSRIIDFVGQAPPEGARFTMGDSWYWGDPILQSVNEAIQDAMTATGGFASLIDDAKNDIIKIPDLMANVGTDEYEQRLITRLTLAATGKSTWRATILDGEEEWEQRQINWAGIPEIMAAFLEVVAGAADIPATRLLGQSPKGLQSTGKGEQQDYHDKVAADQGELLRPQLERLDPVLIRSATGKLPDDIWWEFNPLRKPDESQDAEIEYKRAQTVKIYGDTGLISEEALAEIAKNAMIESGRWAGCEAAFEANPDLPEEDEPDPAELQTEAELAAAKVEQMRTRKAVNDDQAMALITDARPRTLYVSRKLLNAAEFLKWANAQGFGDTLDAASLHVTVCYSKTPLDWLKIDSAWDGDDGKLTVAPGGARIVERLGDKGAVVLLFNSSSLSWRHESIVRAGASHDFDDYQPHVTVSWNVPADFDLDAVEPYRGKLIFGPEIFSEIDEDRQPPNLLGNG